MITAKEDVCINLPALLNMAADCFIIIDSNRNLVFHNLKDASSDLFIDQPVQYGQPLMSVIRGELVDLVSRIIDQIVISRKPYRSELEYKDVRGRLVYLSVSYLAVTLSPQNDFHIYILVRDITPQRIFEKRLSTEVKNISILVEKANAMVIGLDARGYITDWNECCTNVTGFTKNDVYTKKFSLLFLPDNQKALFRELPRQILENHSIANQEITIKRKDGQLLTILLNGTARTTASGETVGAILVGQDVSELMKYRQSLEAKVEERTGELLRALKKEREVVELKNRFVSIASHEFRTPLSAIQASVNFVRQNGKRVDNGEINLRLDNIETQVQHMTSLLDDVLIYGKSDSGKIQIFPTKVELPDFLNKIVAEVEHSTRHTHVVQKDFQTLPAIVTTDEKLLRSILTNLLSNSIKFSPQKNRIFFHSSFAENCLIMSIRDEGIGISPHDRSRIFEPFLRGREATHIEGTGLGLSIVKKAIDLLSGHIQVQSTLGKGSLFTIKIPIKSDDCRG